ncbi:hypothetical protein DWV00_07605 [Trinickia dinghuensis]|uniref:Uncharacterized protein n=2 Tax=Trinickia dinghuensis TaxID=2291023 RepID=A0A3D8K3P6_9BURK|nr:hypothetical protein DWV00_07605 [Trinickia dinghuensis]
MEHSAQWAFDIGMLHDEISAGVVPLRRRAGHQRIELIGEVVDAFVRLRGSVLRFVAMLSGGEPKDGVGGAPDSQRFDQLLSSLAIHAERAKLRRLGELKRFIRYAALAEAHRDIIFSESPVADEAALRDVADALEHLDTMLVGLCVDHMLACGTRTALPPFMRSDRQGSAIEETLIAH